MSPKANCCNRYSKINSKRFDFGVPLEDVFPPNDIHPRLKYLFEEAYRVSLESGITIDRILTQFQGPLETRLKLKEKIVYDIHYHIKRDNIDESPGAYFWAIRHFLGLLPISLLPEYARETQFDWNYLSERCHRFLRHYENDRRKICQLDYEIAENLNLLPFEHFLLLYVMIIFIRKLSLKPTCRRQISRRTLVRLAKYYCSAIGRPYRPGEKKNEKLFPLFFYLLLRWRYVEKNCRRIGHPAYFLETDCLNFDTYRGVSIRDSSAQTASFSPEIITVYRNLPYICNNNSYLKDTECQTDISDFIDKCIQNVELNENSDHFCTKASDEECKVDPITSTPLNRNFTIKTDEETYETFEKVIPTVKTSFVDIHKLDEAFEKIIHLDISSNEIASVKSSVKALENEYDIVPPIDDKLLDETSQIGQICPYKEDLSFVSPAESKAGWSSVVKEKVKTVKKVEEYIYDDYETFSKEDYNQISSKKNDSSLFDKISKIGWTYTPKDTSKMTSTEESNSQIDESQIYFQNSYFKFADVFENDGSFKTNDEENSGESTSLKEDSINKIVQCSQIKTPSWNNPIYGKGGKGTEYEPKNKKTFSLKRFKINLDFLRVLTPRKSIYHTPSSGNIGSNVKYKKIKNVKSTTF